MVRTVSNNTNPQNSQPARPTTSRLSNRFEITVTGGCWCPECGETIRACDAEALDDDAMRLVCRCGHLILHYELQL
jgi:hypothetical protein